MRKKHLHDAKYLCYTRGNKLVIMSVPHGFVVEKSEFIQLGGI